MKINKDNLWEGDIILFHTKGFSPFSWAIRNVTKSYWNHVGMYVGDFVIEALGNGVVKTPIEKYLDNDNFDYKIVRLKTAAFKDMQEYNNGISIAVSTIAGLVGHKYDYGAIVWLGIIYYFKAIMGKVRRNPFQSRQEFFCSELVCSACYKISSLNPYLFQGKTKQKCSTTTPKDISKSEWVFFLEGLDKL